MRAWIAGLSAVAALAGCTSAASEPTPVEVPVAEVPVILNVDRERSGPGIAARGPDNAPYNYAPTVVVERGRYRMWWCSQVSAAVPPGDDIILAETGSLDVPFGPGVPVFSGGGGFDAMHVCDPSVVVVGGIHYLYYTGSAGDHAHGNAIGLATSPDGRVWTRRSQPIVTASHDVVRDNVYGVGQPSAVYLDGWFYLMFTDTTGRDAGWNGAGQFVLRSRDPGFARAVEVLSPGGFRPDTGTGARLRSVVDAFSADLMWVGALGAFAIAHETEGGTTITFWDRDFRTQPYHPVLVPGPWQEGPGLVRDPAGHAPPALDDPCDRVPLDLVRATTNRSAPTDLIRYGLDLTGTAACADPDRTLPALNGAAMPSPPRTMDLVTNGSVIRVERRAVAERLATRVIGTRLIAPDTPVAANLPAGAPALRAADRLAFLLDGKLWTFTDPTVALANDSPITDVTPAQWDAHPVAGSL